jgi:hypothetical protein
MILFLGLSGFANKAFSSKNEPLFAFKLEMKAKKVKPENEIRPFTTDGCSRFPDGLFGSYKGLWLICCELHDISYWAGHGNEQTRSYADNELGQCVDKKTNGWLGDVVWSGPRMAKWLNTGKAMPSSYRWGYGWPFVTGSGFNLNEEQRISIGKNLLTIVPAIEKRRKTEGFPPLTQEDRSRLWNRISELFTSLGLADAQ